MLFAGFDGAAYIIGAGISATTRGTIGANRIPANLQFFTHPDGVAANPTLRMTIAPSGNVVVATPDAGIGLTVSGGGITATVGDVTITDGDLTLTAPTTRINMPGFTIQGGAGAPAAGLAVNVGDLYINTTAASVLATRMYIATAPGAWTNIVCAA